MTTIESLKTFLAKRLEAADSAGFHQAFEAAHPGKAAEIRAAFEGAGEGGRIMTVGEDFPREQARCRTWRPAVGERCFLFASGEWRLAERIEDEYNGVRRYRSLASQSHATVTWFEVPEHDGVRPLDSLPVPPSCGGEPEPRERADRPAIASERPGLVRLLEWARAKAEDSGAQRKLSMYEDRIRDAAHEDAYADCVREIEREISALAPPSIAEAPSASVEPEWIVNDIAELGVRLGDRFFYLYKGGNISYEDGHDSGEPMRWRPVYKREFGEVCHPFSFKGLSDANRYELGDGWKDMPARSAPPSIAEDLRAPEPGAFEGAVVVGGDDQLEREIEALAREVTREDRNRAVREALAELRGILTRERAADNLSYLGIALAAQELDEFAERFKP